MIPRWAAILFLCIGFLGFLDATYLTVEHYRGVIPPCSVVEGCDAVLTSEYALVYGIPVSLLGAGYYLLLFLLGIFALERGIPRVFQLAYALTPLGLLASGWFMYVQFFILKSVCLYCLFSAATSTALFAIGTWGLFRARIFPWQKQMQK